jgi:hypothetical protein
MFTSPFCTATILFTTKPPLPAVARSAPVHMNL